MKPIQHKIEHQYQPTGTSCSPAALSMLLGFYGKDVSVEEIEANVPHIKNDKGEDFGTINQQLAAWCLMLGFEISLYTFDCQIIDQSWAHLPKNELLSKLEKRKNGWQVPTLGHLNQAYAQSYIDFISTGGKLFIAPYSNSKLLYKLLKDGPFLPAVNFNTLYGKSKARQFGDYKSDDKRDDINGRVWNHSVVVYGHDQYGYFLVADPMEKPGRHKVEPERLLAAISAAQIECDNFLFQLK